jgi:stage III sporulation protein AE
MGCVDMKNTEVKFIFFCLVAALFVGICTTYVGANDVQASTEDIWRDFSEALEGLPPSITENLPDTIADSDTAGEGVSEMASTGYFIAVIQDILDVQLSSAIKLFASLIAVIIIFSTFGVFKNSFGESALPYAVRFCAISAVLAIILANQYPLLVKVKEYFEQLNSFMVGMIPITGAAWAMGGNVSTASAGTAMMYIFLNLSQYLFGKTVLPVAAMGTCLSFCNGISPQTGAKRISASIRRTYVFCLGGIMTLFAAILTTQTTITAAADSTTARTAKFVSSTIIPIVGGSVGDSLRTVASSVQYLKSILGSGCIVIILIMVLPVLLSLLLTRLALSLSAGVSEFLGGGEVGGMLNELADVYAGIIAAVAITSIMFILSFFIFIKTTVAIS